MATVSLSWPANPADENVIAYAVYQDGALVSSPAGTSVEIPDVVPGAHVFEIAAINEAWGEGPKSDPGTTPKACTKVGIITIKITIG
jgi:hypothetical protein